MSSGGQTLDNRVAEVTPDPFHAKTDGIAA
jgi:hypothetical protein